MNTRTVIVTRQSPLDDSSDDSCVSRTLTGDGSYAWAKAYLSGAEDLWQYAVPLDIFFDYVVAPYPLHLYSHAKCAMDTGADRGTWLEGRSSSSSSVQFSSFLLPHFFTIF